MALLMLILLGARERTEAEFRTLLGLGIIEAVAAPTANDGHGAR
jgi:hypothetical protein